MRMRRMKLRHIKHLNRLPLFPIIPIVPVAVFVGSLVTSIRALVRVRRLERRLAAAS